MSENPEQDHVIYSMTQLDQDDEDIIYMQNYLATITQRINPPFFERKMQRGVAETIEEEIEEGIEEEIEDGLDRFIFEIIEKVYYQLIKCFSKQIAPLTLDEYFDGKDMGLL